MKVIFDGYWWFGGPPSGRLVVRELVSAWIESFPDDEVWLACRRSDVQPLQAALPNLNLLPLDLPIHALAAAFEVPWKARGMGAQILTQNFAPLARNGAVFIHDAIFKEHPEWFSMRERLYLSFIGLLLQLTNSTVLTSSKTEARRIKRFLRAKEISAVGLAVASFLSTAVSTPPRGAPKSRDFFLSVGRLNVRKNLATVVCASAASETVTEDTPLVVVGEPNGLPDDGPAIARQLVNEKALCFLGRVSDGELRWLYENARALIYLSLDEGYGLPPIEASAFGTVRILSDIPILREVNGDGPIYTDPLDVEALAEVIRDVPEKLKQMRVHQTAIQTSWADVAVKVRQVLGNQKGIHTS